MGYIKSGGGLLLPVPGQGKGHVNNGKGNTGGGHGGNNPGGGNVTAQSIYNNTLAWWPMDDNAANTVVTDTRNTNNLTSLNGFNTNTMYQNTPAFLNGWLNISSSSSVMRIPRSNTAFDKGDTDFSWGGWFKLAGYTTFAGGFATPIMGRWPLGSAGNLCYGLYVNRDSASPLWICSVSTTGSDSNPATIVAPSAATIQTTWYFLVGIHDSVNNEVRLWVNSTKATRAHSAGVFSGGVANFSIQQGIINDSTFVDTSRSIPSNTYQNECFFVNRALTDAEVTYLYNNGAGKTFAQMAADAGH